MSSGKFPTRIIEIPRVHDAAEGRKQRLRNIERGSFVTCIDVRLARFVTWPSPTKMNLRLGSLAASGVVSIIDRGTHSLSRIDTGPRVL